MYILFQSSACIGKESVTACELQLRDSSIYIIIQGTVYIVTISGEMAEQLAPTDSIGIHLKEEYGSKPPNTHIGCFYIKLGQEICQYPRILLQAIDALKSILGSTEWGKTEPGVFFFIAPETTTTDERKHEEEMNTQIREKLIDDRFART